jgi:hypothetical protein
MRTVIVSTIALILLGLTGSAQAIPCVGLADELPGLTGVTCSMIDNEQQLTVSLLGAAVTQTTTKVVPDVFTFFGTNWKVRLTIDLTDNPAGDQVFLLGRVFHQAQPHPAEDKGPGDQIVFSALGATSITPFGWTINGLPTAAAHGNHSDRYTVETLIMAGVPGAPDQIANWGFEFKGIHVLEPIPEPGTLLLFGSSLVGLGGLAWRRHRRK